MANIPRKEDLPIQEIKPGNEFVLVKYTQKRDENCEGKLYLVQNPDKVSLTFGDDIVVSYKNVGSEDRLPYTTARVISMFNEHSDFFMRTLFNTSYVEFLEDNLSAKWHGEKVIANITNPSSPMGANSGGMSVTGQDADGNPQETSPSTQGQNGGQNGQNGQNGQGGHNFEITVGGSGGFADDEKATEKENENASKNKDIYTGKVFKFKKKR